MTSGNCSGARIEADISAPMKITLNREGSRNYTKTSYPVRYGRYSEVEHNGYHYQFNLNGEIKHITGTGPDWPHPAEWLKRTATNDWLYYSTGNYYAGVVDLFGEYYFPYPDYPTNCLFKENPFGRQSVKKALNRAEEITLHVLAQSRQYTSAGDAELLDFLARTGGSTSGRMREKADRLRRILKARVTVLPPDCRHVDYDVIPVMISDGCLYNCSFCEVKSGLDLRCRTRKKITDQLHGLREFYGTDLVNYNSIYLGQHDALAGGPDDIIFSAETSYEILNIEESYMKDPKLFLFGSAESFLRMDRSFWASLDRLPFYTYVNLGLESFDDRTLEFLKKPVNSQVMLEAFHRMLDLNRRCENIEITANFLLGEELPAGHIPALLNNIGESLGKHKAKGCIYMSPLKSSRDTKKLLEEFRNIKHRSRMDTFLYLIQKL
ncbi:MAG: hypothetical protein JRF02_04330 [Deltaproteobacteria bacterium]|jgi:hypothetical protein|nr:hypothetical protein [Deltaproteobacteria bacterium]